jgi:gluconokinase
VTAAAGLPRVLLIMGVSGSGKSTAGEGLSRELGWPFRDADSFHPPANVAKMRSGQPLDDDDRRPWLAAIGAWIDERCAAESHGIVTCSALKRRYRDQLLAGRAGSVRLIYLDGDIDLIRGRMERRHDHFMPPALLRSQFDALEVPALEENAIRVSVHPTARRVVESILAALAAEAL